MKTLLRLAVLLSIVALFGIPAQAQEVAPACAEEPAVDTAEVDFTAALAPTPAENDLLQPTAICRLRPECDANADCDAICGAGLGKCGHSKCPVRVCRCS